VVRVKLVRYGDCGNEAPGLISADGTVLDLSSHVADVTGAALDPSVLAKLEALDLSSLPRVAAGVRLGPPVGGVNKVIGVGLNYSDHAAEAGIPLPTEPLLFMKAASSISGPNDPVVIPKGSTKTDWEVELAVVIGTVARYVSKEEAPHHIAGYTVCNDLSERDFQFNRQGQFVKGKSADSFAPIGPWLVTANDVPNPQELTLWLDLNGERMQTGSTSKMVFSINHLVSYVSEFMTLTPGDIITTGTPSGVGMSRKPPRFLRPGDTMRLGIDRLGEQLHTCTAWTSA
jgi:2-keto-4-pentenoate hydratase/2-oxohepta-3-ene-1,7-dioic acid hydratase in catechol pathway